MSKQTSYTGYTVVTRAMLLVRDYTVYPPDRPVAPYKVMIGGVVKDFIGTWGDYLRDLDNGIVVVERPPFNESEKTMDEMIIGDIYTNENDVPVAPDKPFLVDPLRSFA